MGVISHRKSIEWIVMWTLYMLRGDIMDGDVRH
jgi:hypothetical protein